MITTESSIRAAYVADHEHLDALLKCFRQWKWSNIARAREFFNEFEVGLRQHMATEEKVLFPLFEQKSFKSQTRPTEVMRREHRQIASALEAVNEKICARDPNSENEEYALLAALAVHNEYEQNILCATLDRLLSDAEKAEALAEMEKVPEAAREVDCAGQR